MAPCHQAGRHPAFPLSDATVAEEVVAVHNGQLTKEELNGALAPALLWTLPLRQAQRRDPFNHLWEDIRRYETGQSTLPVPAGVWWVAHGCGEPGYPAGCMRATPASHSGWNFHCSLLLRQTRKSERVNTPLNYQGWIILLLIIHLN